MAILTCFTERLALPELTRVLRVMGKLDQLQISLKDTLALKLAEVSIKGVIIRKGYLPQRQGTNIYLINKKGFYEN